jgi:hypothetical protein
MRFFSAMLKLLGQLFRLPPDPLLEDETAQHLYVSAFHQAVGGALTTWAIMETRLVLIASLLLKADPQKTGLIFYSIINFHGWIAIITELFPMEPDYEPFQKRWNKISKRLRAEKDYRDRLAHNIVVSRQPVSQVSPLDFRSKSKAFKPLTIEQVVDFRDRVGAITDALDSLFKEMQSVVSPSKQKSPELNPDQSP